MAGPASKLAAQFGDFQLPAFTQHVIDVMQKHFPEELADRSWDNVGLLVGNIEPAGKASKVSPKVLLTNDLTFAVGEEAIERGASVIISYHPFIFSGLKSITPADPQQATLLRLVQHNIAVYCPHTAVDAAHGGINDWLLKKTIGDAGHLLSVLRPVAHATVAGAGFGRHALLESRARASDLLRHLDQGLGNPGLSVAMPPGLAHARIRSVAVCAGSGFDVLRDVDAQLIVTGEMSHHHALRLKQMGKIVATVFHSNSERGFLGERLRPLLLEELKSRVPEVEVMLSAVDSDPFRRVVAEEDWDRL